MSIGAYGPIGDDPRDCEHLESNRDSLGYCMNCNRFIGRLEEDPEEEEYLGDE